MTDSERKLWLQVAGYLATHTRALGDEPDRLIVKIGEVVGDVDSETFTAGASARTAPGPMRFGVYRKLEGHTGVGMLYQFLMLARHHTTGEHFVLYIPLRIEPEWVGTIRPCLLERGVFEQKFEYVGEGLPNDPDKLFCF